MNKQDKLQRFLFEGAFVRGEIVRLHQTYQLIVEQHEYPPIIRQLVGQALVMVCLMTGIVKFKGRLTLQFQNKSGLKLLLAQSNQDLQIRALAQWEGELDEAQLAEDLKKGTLAIIMDPDSSTQRYQGIVSWRGNSLAESIEGYFQDSEQLLTRIWMAIDDTRAAGLLLQMLPGEAENNADKWEHLTILTDTIKPDELLSLETKVLLHRLYSEEDIRVYDPTHVEFKCTCSPERGQNAILLLGREEAEEELQLKQVIVVRCDFCNREYTFDRVDVENIFRQGGIPPSSTQIH